PGIDSPPAIDGAARAKQGIPSGLTDARQILTVDEHPKCAELPLGEQANDRVGLADRPVRILFEPLPPRVVPLDSHSAHILPLPHGDQARTMTWRLRNVLIQVID